LTKGSSKTCITGPSSDGPHTAVSTDAAVELEKNTQEGVLLI